MTSSKTFCFSIPFNKGRNLLFNLVVSGIAYDKAPVPTYDIEAVMLGQQDVKTLLEELEYMDTIAAAVENHIADIFEPAQYEAEND